MPGGHNGWFENPFSNLIRRRAEGFEKGFSNQLSLLLRPIMALVCALGCRGAEPTTTAPADSAVTARDIRVLLGVSESDMRVGVRGDYVVTNRSGAVLSRGRDLSWSLIGGGRGVTLGNQALGDTWIELSPEGEGLLAVSSQTDQGWSEPRYYAGLLRLVTQRDSGVQVINVVDVESYVAGVLPGELYPNFHRESYRTQAIAARTYALYRMSTSTRDDYDVSDGEAAQVYGGIADTEAYREACAAVEYTRGLVCTWASPSGERIFCTFFSSACGGRTQNVAFTKSMKDIAPLAGGVACDFCQIAKGEVYRWPDRSLTKAELLARIVARYPLAAELGELADVTVLEREPGGRPVRIGLVGSSGKSFELAAENFRLAVGSRIMRSTACDIRVDAENVYIENGKGFGHGMGLCQWGMEGQARQGRTAAEILRYYYPESQITRAY